MPTLVRVPDRGALPPSRGMFGGAIEFIPAMLRLPDHLLDKVVVEFRVVLVYRHDAPWKSAGRLSFVVRMRLAFSCALINIHEAAVDRRRGKT